MLELEPVPDWGYKDMHRMFAYEDTSSYRFAAAWLDGRGTVEDWGCGTAWAKQFFTATDDYRGLDGTWSQFCDEVVDLRTYRSNVPCIMMRHVLEHNAEWRLIAENFAASWTDRAVLVMFIPPQPEDMDVGGPEWPIPDMAVSGPDLFELLDPHGDVTFSGWIEMHYPPDHPMQWGWEGVVLMER